MIVGNGGWSKCKYLRDFLHEEGKKICQKDTPLWHLRVAAALSSFYFNQIFLPIFPYDHTFLTVAYKTMIYNEFHRPTTGFSWSLGISSQEKMGGKMSKNPKYRTLQAVKLGLLQSCYCSN